MSATDYAASAAAGAAFLDERRPGWAGRINLDKLALIDGCDCILGQLDGDYDRGLAALGVTLDEEYHLGFLSGDSAGGWDRLDAAWTAEVTKRREPAEVTP